MPESTTALTIAAHLQAAARGDGWVQVGDERVSWGELQERAHRVAGGLAGLGVGRGGRVLTILPNRLAQLELLFAAAVSGAVLVPLSPFLRGAFLRHQLLDADPHLVIADAAGLAACHEHLAALPELRGVVLVGPSVEGAAGDVVPYTRLAAGAPASAPGAAPQPTDTIAMLFTSGTTGASKCCIASNAYYVSSGRAVADAWTVTPDDVYFTALPLHHGAGQVAVLMTALVAGASFCAVEAFRASTFFAQAREAGATLCSGVGAMARALLARPPAPDDRDHRLRLLVMSPLDVASQKAFTERFGVPLSPQAYGQTECICVTVTPGDQFGPPSRTVGPPSPLFEVAIHDVEGHAVPVGVGGEIVVRPRRPGVMFDGYWRRPEATVAAFRGLWHHTGDVGHLDEAGHLTFLDRGRDAMRRRGENVSSAELEAAVSKHPKIVDVAAHAVPASMTEDDIKVCLVLADGEEVAPDELFAFFGAALPYFAIPRYVEVLDALPRETTSMRVRKLELRERGVTPTTWDLEALGYAVPREQRR